MILYIHSHEIEDRGITMDRHAAASDVVHIVVPDGTDVPGIVALVNAQVRDRGSIWTLIFNGHGDDHRSGAIYFGDWINTPDVTGFSTLAPFMNPVGRGVEIHCCRSGSNEAFVQAMANAFNVRVTAGVENQLGRDHIPFTSIVSPIGGDTFGVIEGPSVVAFPGGRTAHSSGGSPSP